MHLFLTIARGVTPAGDRTFDTNGLGVTEVTCGDSETMLYPVLLITHEPTDAGIYDGEISLRNADHQIVPSVSAQSETPSAGMAMSVEIAPRTGTVLWAAKTSLMGVSPGEYAVVLFLGGRFAASWPLSVRPESPRTSAERRAD